MDVTCQFARDSFVAGSAAVCRLRVPGGVQVRREAVVLAQVVGVFTLDTKWAKASKTTALFVQNTLHLMDQPVTLPPVAGSNNTHCVFVTPREVVPTSQLNDGGVFLLFDLPEDAIPSYKGLACTISYAVAVTVQTPGAPTKHAKFSFSVVGRGSAAVPYEVRYSALAQFGAGAVPIENALLVFDGDAAAADSDGQGPDRPGTDLVPSDAGGSATKGAAGGGGGAALLGQLFNIRDRDTFVCALSMASQGDHLRPGCDVCVTVSFDGAVRPCFAVRAYLQQYENRADGSRVQDKVVAEASRATLSAELIHLKMHLPDALPCSFTSPLICVCYQVVVEFFLDTRPAGECDVGPSIRIDEEDHSEPFTWVVPVDVEPLKYSRNVVVREVNLCY